MQPSSLPPIPAATTFHCRPSARARRRSCPYAHPGEAARRRSLDRFDYGADLCAHARRGACCPLGDACPMAHNAWEVWLHPDKYLTKVGAPARTAVVLNTCLFHLSPAASAALAL
jgi:hypothetical protein